MALNPGLSWRRWRKCGSTRKRRRGEWEEEVGGGVRQGEGREGEAEGIDHLNLSSRNREGRKQNKEKKQLVPKLSVFKEKKQNEGAKSGKVVKSQDVFELWFPEFLFLNTKYIKGAEKEKKFSYPKQAMDKERRKGRGVIRGS